jgi:hypothetical protein
LRRGQPLRRLPFLQQEILTAKFAKPAQKCAKNNVTCFAIGGSVRIPFAFFAVKPVRCLRLGTNILLPIRGEYGIVEVLTS